MENGFFVTSLVWNSKTYYYIGYYQENSDNKVCSIRYITKEIAEQLINNVDPLVKFPFIKEGSTCLPSLSCDNYKKPIIYENFSLGN
ncbi:hypothetical protein [Bacillus thuringiensis]|uniref:hypothetical protein n=1 Tax=Bacillus thuringiensis TaxID=1428 RepID=UPI002AB4805E|nr:hypothetical protein [Bacillus thuringiensis]MDY7965282.1 hypothetical protein [Bacillus thuringiensis]MDY8165775.1 hypothetical protein [Bacillus thuringiensis]